MAQSADAIIAEIFALVLEKPVAPGEVVRRDHEPKWDSLKHVEIVMAFEAAGGAALSAEEMAQITSSADLLDRLQRAG